ncbi:hypothetical protein [Sphingobacterium griseoflavum]|uniref:Uncharacterized protein n=1 Tax=Sphingobacterium griseoflavum TaxID=1474952 RepID=A0ABQ3I138_9SPHI|nr:hypothetical protein [Sphingobacterium griseoflavum]GHE44375.1 hypothetical protein GCM10017764_29470 [Sphingobacterium griseoflavum]
MSQDNKPDKQPLALFIFIAFLLLWFFYSLYKHWNGIIEPENGYNGIDTIVGMGGLLLNAVTIYFVYITYQQQRDQIIEQSKHLEKTDEQVEFERVLSVLYQQLQFTLINLKNNTYKLAMEEIGDIELSYEDIAQHFSTNEQRYTDYIFSVAENIQLLNRIIVDNTLPVDKREYLRKIAVSNIGMEYFDLVMQLRIANRKAFDGRHFHKKQFEIISSIKKKIVTT